MQLLAAIAAKEMDKLGGASGAVAPHPVDTMRARWDGVRMSKKRSKLAQAALVSNGMVWFGASFMLVAIAAEQTAAVFAGTWLNVLGWTIILLVATGLAVVGVIENVNIRAGKKYKPRPRS